MLESPQNDALHEKDVKKISIVEEDDYKLHYDQKQGYYNYIMVYFKK